MGATELLIETVELPMAFIGDWGGLDGFERAVPGDPTTQGHGNQRVGSSQAHGTGTENIIRNKEISLMDTGSSLKRDKI